MFRTVDLDVAIEEADGVRLGLLVDNVGKGRNLGDPLIAGGALLGLGLLKGKQVVDVDYTLVAKLKLQKELRNIQRQKRLVYHEAEFFLAEVLSEGFIALVLFQQKLLDHLGEVLGRA